MSSVTVWHFENGGYENSTYQNSTVFLTEAVSENGMHQNGFAYSSRAEVRIFTDTDLPIAVGDRIGDELDNSYKITALKKNFRGTRPHYHITAEK